MQSDLHIHSFPVGLGKGPRNSGRKPPPLYAILSTFSCFVAFYRPLKFVSISLETPCTSLFIICDIQLAAIKLCKKYEILKKTIYIREKLSLK